MGMDLDISHPALYEVIADRLEAMILSDTSQISQKLPSEQQLADRFSVSRPVIREALKLLKERGLISSRQGAPTVITDGSPEVLIRNLNRITCMKNVSSTQIHQIRTSLEILAASLAAENRTDSQLAELEALNRDMRSCGGDMPRRARLDAEFHRSVARMSGNPLLEIISESLAALIEPLIAGALDAAGDADGVMQHDRLISALRCRNAALATELMRTHMLTTIRNYDRATGNIDM